MATYTTDQYNALVAAMALGATFVKYSDKEVHYRSLAEMASLKAQMEVDLGIANAPRRKWRGVYTKALDGCGRDRPAIATTVNSSPSLATAERTIIIFVKTAPDLTQLIAVGGGLYIYAQYAPGNTLQPLYYNTTTPYLGGKPIVTPLFMNNEVEQ